jgi:DNA-binding transcriptional ArsR family regulator
MRSARRPRSDSLRSVDPEFEGLDMRVVKAVSHPLRQKILFECSHRAASPSDLADEWGESRSGVAYHFRVLNDLGAVELVEEERVRGSVKHYYRTVLRYFFDDRQWAQLPVEFRRSALEATIRRIGEHLSAAGRDHRLDDPRTHVSQTALTLDPEGYAEVCELLLDVLRRVLEIDAEADERRQQRGGGETITTELAILHFHREASHQARISGRS